MTDGSLPTQLPSAVTRPATLRSGLRNFGCCAVDFLYPPHCEFCQTPLPESDADRKELCHACRDAFLLSDGPACRRCGSPVGPNLGIVEQCYFCQRRKFAFERVIRLGIYQDQLRLACLQSKGGRQQPLTAALARLAFQQNEEAFRETPIDVVVPVPHFWVQRLFRLHNPADTISGVWAHILMVRRSGHILLKRRWTRPQRSLPASRRPENVRRAFKVSRPQEIRNATVLLVDDIMTTGATVHEAAASLKRAGAGKVITAVLARAT